MSLFGLRLQSILCMLLLAGMASGRLLAADLRVMTWDVEDAYPPEKTEVLAKTVKKHKVDILAMQNIPTEGTHFHQQVQAELDKLFGKGVFAHSTTRGSRFDGNAVFWNTRTVQVSNTSEDGSIKLSDLNLHPAQIVRAKAGTFNFRLVNVNLYEGLDHDDDDKIKQAATLRKLLKKIGGKGGTNAVILAGNLQMGFPNEKIYDEVTDDYDIEENPAYHALNPDHFLKFCTQDIARKNPRAFSYIGDLLESGRLIDHIAVNDAAWKNYIKNSAKVIRVDRQFFEDTDDYEWNFSDHLPVMARFKTK